ncbi:substrate-binding domain-containing protein [Mycolicibacterium fortuitum]|uniref:Substrate-binding domain-containing protein n=1 Tax=Mycolicibacterium fortuitum TaxID=1766 RepID=A0AAE4V973_MYCFO|nr:substrate-binding domain-containing protein [Mycolicibacterium fortuitum]MDV7190711.1 substrate-binding domain-containing protein [Mycolicibacterium fortuitum]MDV7203922.1 substrate-binding domain-containing protein [Mycolicibacterium fortuitum]MDV7225243.1 substrate-binding domain-containing protein [Mycolicibacterium fortuitum]MDV7257907.1 substrate-binding domain-containing protein [Mycolicibacterium fortuitum]MDV7282897.1 substrate-binding domain-containing protein [Mycolicibacterium fo
MGRHSIPDPEDAPDEPDHGHVGDSGYRDDYDRPRGEQSRHAGDDDFDMPGRQPDRGYGDVPAYRDEPGYRDDRGYRAEPDYRAPQYGDGDDDYESDYHDSEYADYDEAEYVEEDGYEDEYVDGYRDQYAGDDYDTEYADDYADDQPTAQFGAVGGIGDPPPPSTPTSRQRGDWDGEWTGSHRAVESGRRGVSVGVIVALVTVVAVVGAMILWKFFGDVLADRSDAAAARCVDGELGVAVIADPTISTHIEGLANKYNESVSPVGDRCVKVRVQSAESDRVVSGFANTWPSELGDRPALWIPASSIAEARLEATAGAKTVSDSRSLVTSPVLLAVRPQLKDALAQQTWATLPQLQSSPAAMNALKLPGWGTLKLALPTQSNGDSASLAAEAVAAATAPAGAPATSGMSGVNTLFHGQPKLDDSKLGSALDALLNASDPATAPVHAVATTEQQLFQRATSVDNVKSTLAGWLPPGPTASSDYPTVLLAGDWLEKEQVTAASEFARYLRKPEQLAELAKAGFRAEGTTPPSSDVTSFSQVAAPLSVGDNAMRVTLANATATPTGNPAVTIMLDQSMPTEEGGKSRLANVVAALNSRLKALPDTAAVGLWTFDGTEGRSEVSTGPLAEPVSGQRRSDALTATLDEQSASGGGAVSYTTLRMLYNEALSKYHEGQTNSILVITTGPHTDQSLDGPGLQDFIRGAFDPARPIAVNVIDFGTGSDRATWEAVAQASSGTYQHLTSSASPELAAAVNTMLG